MYQKPAQPAEIGGVLEDALAIYRVTFRRCLPIAVLGALTAAALDLFVVLFAHHEGMPFDSLESSLLVYQQPPVMALGLLQAVVMLGLFGALLVTQHAIVNARVLPLGAALGLGFGRLGRCAIATLVYVAVTLVGCLLILPGIYIGNVWSLYPAAIYLDDAGALPSLDDSRRLTAGRWWHTATVLGAGMAAVLVIAMVSDALAGGLTLLGSVESPALQSGMQLVGDAANVFVLPMIPATLLALYNDLKLRIAAPRAPSR